MVSQCQSKIIHGTTIKIVYDRALFLLTATASHLLLQTLCTSDIRSLLAAKPRKNVQLPRIPTYRPNPNSLADQLPRKWKSAVQSSVNGAIRESCITDI